MNKFVNFFPVKKAFTLSEVLISLVIIGIIAAVTVPLIYAQYTERERISKVKKTYSALANAMTRVKADGGDIIFDHEINDDMETLTEWYNKYLKNYIVTTKVCYNEAGCWSYPVYYLNGSKNEGSSSKGMGSPCVSFILNDGTFVALDRDSLYYAGLKVTTEQHYYGYGILIYFDINGEKAPNTFGKDIFLTAFTDDGFMSAYNGKTSSVINSDCSSSGTGYSCIQKYLKL